MARPRSVLGLLGELASLHVRKRPVLVASLVAGAVMFARLSGGDEAPPATRTLQAAVLGDGFAILAGSSTDRHVIGYGEDGQRRFRRSVPLSAPDVRMVGTSAGPAVGWLDKAKQHFATVPRDGELGKTTSWGKAVRFSCDGVATNEHRFGIGWADKDNRVWFVSGPVGKTRAIEAPSITSIEATAVSWCGVASAHQDVVLFWRDGATTYANFCGKQCSSLWIKLPIDKSHTLLGFGCTKDNCVLAARDGSGTIKLGWVGPTGKLAWVKTITDAVPGTMFSIIGAGDRAIAVAYVTNEGATAFRVIASGSMVRAWHDPGATETPSLVWARDQLFVAHRHGDAVVPDVVALPR